MDKTYNNVLQILRRAECSSFPINPEKLIEKCGMSLSTMTYEDGESIIKMLKLSEYTVMKEGFTVKVDGTNIILYDGSLSAGARRFVIAHELGHICHRHLLSQPGEETEEQEQEADNFALLFLAPPCVLHSMGVIMPVDIAEKTGISIEQSKYISHYIVEHYGSGERYEPIETDVINRFKNKKAAHIRRAATVSFFAIVAVIAALGIFVFNRADGDQTDAGTLQTISLSEVSQADPSSKGVFVTVHGEKYHVSDCTYVIGREVMSFDTVQEAENSGYEPCKVCRPNE